MSQTTISGSKFAAVFVAATLLFGGAGFAGSLMVPPKWQSDSLIEAPTSAELGNYYSLFSTYHLVAETKPQDSVNNSVYVGFRKLAASYDLAKAFWQATEYYKQKSTDDEQHDNALLDELTKTIQVSEQNGKTRISLTLDNPKRAYELLGSYMDYVNNANKRAVYEELILQWKTLFNQVKTASEVNLAASGQQNWQGKLAMMKTVQPLDDKLQSFHFLKKPTVAVQASHDRLTYTAVGAGVGAVLGLILGFFFGRKRWKHK
ncbi:chain-length determining protein [Pasteurellaceae bacterium LIM206]|nr:chain-length determining protein [Pasteurellaceae bacterium LIM206]